MKILLVSHNENTGDRRKMELTNAGHDVRLARNGIEAWRIFSHGSFQIVISDFNLPGLHGLGLCRRIRRAGRSHYVHVILIAAGDRETIVVKGLSAGANDVLLEPFDSDELHLRIRAVARIPTADKLTETNRRLRKLQSLIRKKNSRLQRLFETAQTLVDNVSHDFRTPLTVIKEYASLISEGAAGGVTSEQQQFLRVIEDRADDLNTMVDDMLDGSRLDAGMISVARRNCQVADLIEHARPVLERKADAKDVELQFAICEPLPNVYVDEEKIGRVLTNLVVNAIKFCGEPGRVRVLAEQDLDGGVRISVTDNGPGIEADHQTEIFERFRQIGNKVRESAKGFGLGLSIARELVDLNLGELELVSAPGSGTTFSFTMPPAQPIDVLRRYLDRISQPEIGSKTVTLIVATDRNVDNSSGGDIGDFLSHQLYRNDLLFRTGDYRWLILSPVPKLELHKMLARLERVIIDANSNRADELLPDLAFEHVGTWSINDCRDEIGRHLSKHLVQNKECYSFS
ncbi:MAG: ATP-binding protein [Planctomycetaceae bacterium]